MSPYREAPRHARPSGLLPHRAHRTGGPGRLTEPMPAAQRLARWVPLIWWILYTTIGPSLPDPFVAHQKWIGLIGTMLLIVLVETWIGVRQRSRPTAAML